MNNNSEDNYKAYPAEEPIEEVNDAAQMGAADDSFQESSDFSSSSLFGSVMDGFSDRLNSSFEKIDDKKKSRLILILGVAALLGGLFYIYRFASMLF